MLERHRVGFGGRETEQARLDAFIQERSGCYLVISGPAGFGKTALLASLVRRAPQTIAYHFFAPNDVIESVDEAFFVRNAVQQMVSWHGIDGDLPTALADLKALYHELLDRPVEPGRVLVLDGVDEVRDWSLRYYLNRPLPIGLNVVLSVRDVGQDWRDDYGLPAEQTTELALGGFTREDVARVLQSAGPTAQTLAESPTVLDELMRVAASEESPSRADPFYVRILADDAQAGRVTVGSIADEPPSLDRYLDNWWHDVRKAAGEQTVQELIGTLVVSLGPLTKDELIAINPNLAGGWASDHFERDVLPKVRRFLVGDADLGYALTHPRLQGYLRTRITSLAAYRERLLAFCAEWPSRPSRYASRHYAQHLAENLDDLDERAALFELVDNREWYGSQIALDPSGAAYAADVAQAWVTASEVDRKAVSAGRSAPLLAREVRCALATASLRSLSRSIGSVFLSQLVQSGLWTPAEALAAIRQNPHSGAKARALAALAPLAPETMQFQIVTEARAIGDDAARADALSHLVEIVPAGLRPPVVAEALSAAASVADPQRRAEALTVLVPLVPDDQRAGVVEQALVAARKIENDEAGLAETLTGLAGLVPHAKRRRIVEQALTAAREIDWDAHARAAALTALANVVPRAKRRSVVGEALAAAREIDDDTQARADALTDLVTLVPRDQRHGVVEEALAEARRVGLSSLVATAAEIASKTHLSAIIREALDIARAAPTAIEQAELLTFVGEVVSQDDAGDILEEALDAADRISDRSQKVSALLRLARLLPEDRGNELVRRVLSAPGAIQAAMTVERDESSARARDCDGRRAPSSGPTPSRAEGGCRARRRH